LEKLINELDKIQKRIPDEDTLSVKGGKRQKGLNEFDRIGHAMCIFRKHPEIMTKNEQNDFAFKYYFSFASYALFPVAVGLFVIFKRSGYNSLVNRLKLTLAFSLPMSLITSEWYTYSGKLMYRKYLKELSDDKLVNFTEEYEAQKAKIALEKMTRESNL